MHLIAAECFDELRERLADAASIQYVQVLLTSFFLVERALDLTVEKMACYTKGEKESSSSNIAQIAVSQQSASYFGCYFKYKTIRIWEAYSKSGNYLLTSKAFFMLSLLEAFLLKLLVDFTGSGKWLYPPPYNRLSFGNKVSAQRRHILSLQHVNSTLHTAPLGQEKKLFLNSAGVSEFYTMQVIFFCFEVNTTHEYLEITF